MVFRIFIQVSIEERLPIPKLPEFMNFFNIEINLNCVQWLLRIGYVELDGELKVGNVFFFSKLRHASICEWVSSSGYGNAWIFNSVNITLKFFPTWIYVLGRNCLCGSDWPNFLYTKLSMVFRCTIRARAWPVGGSHSFSRMKPSLRMNGKL